MTSTDVRRILIAVREREPFFAELISDSGFKLLLGLGTFEGCAQFGPSNGEPPYLMAMTSDPQEPDREMCFLINDTATDVPGRYRLPCEAVLEVTEAFVETGQRDERVAWEQI